MKKRTRIIIRRLIIRALVVAGVVGAFYVYFRTGAFTVTAYDIEGVPSVYVPTLEQKFNDIASRRLFLFLPGNRVLSFHTQAIDQAVKEALPNTRNVHVYPKSFHTLLVSVETYTPLFSLGGTKAMTRDGEVYTDLIPRHDLPELSIASSTAFGSDSIALLASFVPKVPTILFSITYIDVDEHGDMSLRNSSRSHTIKIARDNNADKIWSNLVSAVDADPLKSNLATHLNNLEYIDLRFGNKVFYKFTNGTSTAIISSHATTTTATTTSLR